MYNMFARHARAFARLPENGRQSFSGVFFFLPLNITLEKIAVNINHEKNVLLATNMRIFYQQIIDFPAVSRILR